MAILESGFIYQGVLLVEKKIYPNEEFLSEEIRTSLLSSVQTLAGQAFKDEIQKLFIGKFYIIFKIKNIKTIIDNKEKNYPLMIFCISNDDSNYIATLKAMDLTLKSFLNRYSKFDINQKKKLKFQGFKKRINKNFADLALKLEDRFKSLY